MSESHLRLPTVRARVGLSTSTIYARMAAHDFPLVRKDGAISYWLESEIAAYLAKVEARSSVGTSMPNSRNHRRKAA